MNIPFNTRTFLFVAVFVGVLALLGYALRPLVFAQAALVRESGSMQTCRLCIENNLGDSFTLRAKDIKRSYRFTRDAQYQLQFEGGVVRVAGEALAPGCYVLSGSEGDRLEFENAKELRLASPVPEGACTQ